MDAYSPFPIEELHEALGCQHTRLPLIVLIGGIVGCLGGYSLQYWASAIAYPLNVGGKPFHSWPAFIPVTFECTILARGAVGRARHARAERAAAPYHPVFNVPRFALASRNRFFLCIEASDPKFDLEGTRAFPRNARPARGDDRCRLDASTHGHTGLRLTARSWPLVSCRRDCVLVACRLPPGHARSAEVHPAARIDVLRRRAVGAAARRRARSRADSCTTTRCSTPAR